MSRKKDDSGALTPEVIEKYLKGELSHAKMHEVEKAILASDFDTEAMEGFESAGIDHFRGDLELLENRIDKRISSNNQRLFFWAKIAASITLISTLAFLILNIEMNGDHEALTVKSKKNTKQLSDSSTNVPEQKSAYDSLIALNRSSAKEDRKPTKDLPKKANKTQKEPFKPDMQVFDVPEEIIVDPDANLEEIQDLPKPADAIMSESFKGTDKPGVTKTEITDSSVQGQLANIRSAKKSLKDNKSELTNAASSIAPSSKNTRLITGTVTSAEDGSSLPGVNILIKGTAISTITDVNGEYKIRIPENVDPVVVASYIGFVPTESNGNQLPELDFEMVPDVVALSEVVVIGYGEAEDDAIDELVKAKPVNGRSAFKEYVQKNLRYPSDTVSIKGKVVVDFKVTSTGKLIDFKIKKSLGRFYDQEAIRIIEEGPAWKPATRNGISEQDEVRVRIKFKQ